MSNYKFEGNFKNITSAIDVMLSLLSFEEDNTTIIYSPALDLSGYGKNDKEAKKSFEIALEEFLRYSINKGTFEKVLKKLGWKLSGRKSTRKYKQPYLDHLLRENKYLSDIVREKEFHRINEKVSFPAYA